MAISGISHLTFVVKRLEPASRVWCEGLGAVEVYDGVERNFSVSREKFLLLGGIWIALMEGTPTPRSYRHVAFQATEADLCRCEARLRRLGVEIRPPRKRLDGEGLSLYFYDFDDNLLELHTGTLHERLAAYGNLLASGPMPGSPGQHPKEWQGLLPQTSPAQSPEESHGPCPGEPQLEAGVLPPAAASPCRAARWDVPGDGMDGAGLS